VDYAFKRKQRGGQLLLLEKPLLSGRGVGHQNLTVPDRRLFDFLTFENVG
jgi:hypothetical protein